MKKLLNIFLSFFKVGIIGFGGGSALIPVIEKQIVTDKKLIDDDEYLKHTVISNITPGAQPIKLGALAGYKHAGVLGSLIGAYSITIPGVFICVLIIAMLAFLGDSITDYIKYASVGITIFIIFLLLNYIFKIIGSAKNNNLFVQYIAITLIAFIITGGTEIRSLLSGIFANENIKSTFILFDISTINLMLIAFFMIFFVAILNTKTSLIIGSIISVVYAITVGKNNFFSMFDNMQNLLIIIMILLICYAIIKTKSKTKIKIKFEKSLIYTILCFILIPVILSIICGLLAPADIISNTPLSLLNNVALSTLTSFGGGTAYIAVADGIFVTGGFVSSDMFYSQIVPISNALPGPVLAKIAAAISYTFGNGISGVMYGSLLCITAISVCIGVCSPIALIILSGYDALKDSLALKMLKQYILPVICGMLISTSINMLAESTEISASAGVSPLISLPIILSILIGYFYINKKYKLKDYIVIIIMATLSLILFSICATFLV